MASLALGVAALAASALPVHAAAPYCLPGNACFPSQKVFAKFNETVGGNLIKVAPYGAECYGSTYNADACAALAGAKRDPEYRIELPAGTMYTNAEQYGTVGCPVPDALANGSAPAAVERECTLGNMAAYVVKATSAKDVSKAVKFAAKYNLRLRIKNTGHDYTGRSTGAGAFTIWTHHLDSTEADPEFTPKGCKADGSKPKATYVLKAGPGVDVEALYKWGGENGRVTIGGTTTTVGATGGYILGGGLGPFVPYYGMGVDNVLQYEVVTADGDIKIANECQNQDLFWAMRGGGGAFGVNTRVWLKTYPALKAVNTATGTVVCRDKASYTKMVHTLMDLQKPLRAAGYTGLWEIVGGTYSLTIASVVKYEENEKVQSANATFSAYEPLVSIEGCTSTLAANQYTGSSSWDDAYHASYWPAAEPGSIVGINIQDFSRIVSQDQVDSEAGLQKIKDYLVNLPGSIPFIWQNYIGGVARDVPTDATAVHPAWRKAFAFIDVVNFGAWSGPSAAQNASSAALVANMTETFGMAAYYNEAYDEEDWQTRFFGSNYRRLLSIKKKVDPNGVFSCRLCVGSESGF